MEISPGSILHHIGYAVKNIEAEAPRFARLLDSTWDGVVFHDPLQQARVTFLTPANGLPGAPQIELVEGDTADSPLSRFIDKGGNWHHLCYTVEDLEATVALMKKRGAIVVKAAEPAIAFNGRRVLWMFARPHLLIEYLER